MYSWKSCLVLWPLHLIPVIHISKLLLCARNHAKTLEYQYGKLYMGLQTSKEDRH
jgi:hypothetical protein